MNLTIDKVGDFYEVFDWDLKETLFVSEKSRLAMNEVVRLRKLGKLDWLNTLPTPPELREKGH